MKTKTCGLCRGCGKRYETVVEALLEKRCVGCFGEGEIPQPIGWRPHEQEFPTCDDCGRREDQGHPAECFYHGPY